MSIRPVSPEVLQGRVRDLTQRELEVLRSLGAGLNASDIALGYCLSLATVRTHIVNILRKLGVSSQVQAVALAYRTGICSPD